MRHEEKSNKYTAYSILAQAIIIGLVFLLKCT
jgi:hypothetical protein